MYMVEAKGFYTPKNKLQEQVQEFLRSKNRMLLKDRDLSFFQTQIIQGIERINANNARCKPIVAKWKGGLSSGASDKHLFIGIGDTSDVCQFTLLKCGKEAYS